MEPALLEHLASFLTKERVALFHKILSHRTRHITVVLEDLYQPHNASAVLRSCECFGIQDVHIIEGRNKYQVNPEIALGSSKWLSLITYPPAENNTIETLSRLKQQGYRIVATVPDIKATPVDALDLTNGKIALAFGTELTGLSSDALQIADTSVYIPMYGFTESFNISVSVAVILYQLTTNLRNSNIQWQLTEDEKNTLLGEWIIHSLKSAREIIARWNRDHHS